MNVICTTGVQKNLFDKNDPVMIGPEVLKMPNYFNWSSKWMQNVSLLNPC